MKKKISKKSKKAARARRQRAMLIIGLAAVVILIAVLAVFLLRSSGKYDADTSTVFVLDDGKVVSTTVEPFDENTYSKDELKGYVEEVVDTYNIENGENSVKQKSFSVEENVATLTLEYANADVFESMEGIELFIGSIAEAQAAGYVFDAEFASVADGKAEACTTEAFMNDAELKIVIVKANTKVCVDGEILYVSTANIAEVSEEYVVIKEGADTLHLAVQDGTESVEENIDGTEIPEGAIGEDELLSGEDENAGMVFDFGEEEITGSQYSEVYTFIIYK